MTTTTTETPLDRMRRMARRESHAVAMIGRNRGEGSAQPTRKPEDETSHRVLVAMRTTGRAMTLPEIRDAVGEVGGTLSGCLTKMTARGQVVRAGKRGGYTYTLPEGDA